MTNCKRCDSRSDGHEYCSVEPEAWARSAIVRADRRRARALRRAGLEPTRSFAALERHMASPSSARDFFEAMVAAARPAETRVVSDDTAVKIWGHSLDTAPDARVHWKVRVRTVCGRTTREVLHTSDRHAVTCKQCTFDV